MHYCILFPHSGSYKPPPTLFHSLLREIFWLSGRSECLFPTLGCAAGTRCDSGVRYLCLNPAVSRFVRYIPHRTRLCGFTAMLNEVTLPWSAQTQLWRELARGSRCCSVTWCRVKMSFNETWSVNQEADAEQTWCSAEPEGFAENVDYIGLLMHMQSCICNLPYAYMHA